MKQWHLSKQNLPFLIDILKQNLEENKNLLIKIEEKKETRSNEQNDRLWALYQSIGNHLGYTQDEMHTLMKYKFLRSERIVDGKSIEVILSTTKLSVQKFSEYMQNIETWAGQMGWSDDKK